MTNFAKDWNDGKAIGALVDAVAPGLFPQWEDLGHLSNVERATQAMKAAEEWLGVPMVSGFKNRIFIYFQILFYFILFILFQLKCNNFNKDWNDGVKLASLVDATAPGLFPEWEDLDPKNAVENAAEAMKRAEDWLGVPQVR